MISCFLLACWTLCDILLEFKVVAYSHIEESSEKRSEHEKVQTNAYLF